MTKYLISFPSSAMNIAEDEFATVGDAAHAVMYEAKDAGVYVFSGGINEDVAPVLVASDRTTTNDLYPEFRQLNGGFAVLELPSREDAVEWAAKLAVACRCSQELREFHFDPLV
jgi:hypothetical protein